MFNETYWFLNPSESGVFQLGINNRQFLFCGDITLIYLPASTSHHQDYSTAVLQFLVRDPCKPSLSTATGWGGRPKISPHVVYFDSPSNINSQVKVGQLDVEGQNPTRSFVRRGKQKGTSEEEAQTLEGFEPVEHHF